MFVALVLCSQSFCLAHMHHYDESDPQGRYSPPHVHLFLVAGQFESNFDYRESVEATIRSPLCSHDSDAVCCDDQMTIALEGETDVSPEDAAMGSAHLQQVPPSGCLRKTLSYCNRFSFLDSSHCPIYLRELSLRL